MPILSILLIFLMVFSVQAAESELKAPASVHEEQKEESLEVLLQNSGVNLNDISVEQLDKFFTHIIKSAVSLPTPLKSSLWALYLKVYEGENRKEWNISKISLSLDTTTFYMRNSELLNPQMTPEQQEAFEVFAVENISSIRMNDLSPLYLNDFMDIIINKNQIEAYDGESIGFLKKLINYSKFSEIVTPYFKDKTNITKIGEIQKEFLNYILLKKNEYQMDCFNNVNFINTLIKNPTIKFTNTTKMYLEKDTLQKWGIKPLLEALKSDIYDEVFFEKLIHFDMNNLKQQKDILSYDLILYLLKHHDTLNSVLSKDEKGHHNKQILLNKVLPNMELNMGQITKLKARLNKDYLKTPAAKERWLYKAIHKTLDDKKGPAIKKIADLYTSDNIKSFAQLIFSNLPDMNFKERKKYTNPATEPSKIIYNQDGYTKDKNGKVDIKDLPNESETIKIGKPAILKNFKFMDENNKEQTQDIPIGYNIHLPKGDIKGVFVDVYGGNGVGDRVKDLNRPGILDSLQTYLLEKGIVVISLNLIDFLELTVEQFDMPSHIQDKLHASINWFITALRTKDVLLEGFEIPENIKIYLYGGSFGGRTAVRHAELYPKANYPYSFDGYMSHDGALSASIKDTVKLADRADLRDWLSPLDENLKRNKLNGIDVDKKDLKVSAIGEPVLLLHNFDDNNVNVKASIEFYQEALNCGKEHLVQLFITRRGNPVIDIYFTKGINKGHLITEDETAFKSYAGTIADFILYGPSPITSRSKWMAHQYEIYAHKNYQYVDDQAKFISEAYRLHKKAFYRPAGQSMPENPLLQTKKIGEKEKFERDWKNMYEPLYYIMNFVSPDAKRALIKNLNLITDQTIENALLKQLPLFFDFLAELNKLEFLSNVNVIDFAQDATFKETYKKLLQNSDRLVKKALVDNFLFANLDVIKAMVTEWKKDSNNIENMDESQLKDMEEAKENLWQRIQEDKKHISALPHEMAKVPAYNPERSMDSILKSLMNKDAPYDQKNYTDMLKFASRVLENKSKIYRDQTINYIKTQYARIMDTFSDCVQNSNDCRVNYAAALASLSLIEGDKETLMKAKSLFAEDVQKLVPILQSFPSSSLFNSQNIDDVINNTLLEK